MTQTLEDILNSPSAVRKQWLPVELAVREVLAFERRFGTKHLMLACHAALPMILTPELVNLIRINFLEAKGVPWVAEVDLLLSPLCRPIGEGIYEVEPAIREVLLVELENQFDYERPFALAKFLAFYLARKSGIKRPGIARTQRWIALAYLDPDRAVAELADKLESSLEGNEPEILSLQNQAELVTTVELLAEPLQTTDQQIRYEYLVSTSRSLARDIYEEELEREAEVVTEAGEPEKRKRVVLDVRKFYRATNPGKTLDWYRPEERYYYIDFAAVRGGKIIEEMLKTISWAEEDEDTCQTFTGHIGCGKTTELLRLKYELEQDNFQVVYFPFDPELLRDGLEASEILLEIARHTSESLERQSGTAEGSIKSLLQKAAALLQTEIQLSAEGEIPRVGRLALDTKKGQLTLTTLLGKISATVKQDETMGDHLRQYLGSRTDSIVDALNQSLFDPAKERLRQQGKQGLVVIVDNLDRTDGLKTLLGNPLPYYLFVELAPQLRGLHCHLIYTMPLSLPYSDRYGEFQQRFGGLSARVLPIVPVQLRNGEVYPQGMKLLRDMVLARALPELSPEQRRQETTEIFDIPETLDRLCSVSGGRVRNLLVLLQHWILRENKIPLSRSVLEELIIQNRREEEIRITEAEWQLLRQVAKTQSITGNTDYRTFIHQGLVCEYRDDRGAWFGVNPILADSAKLQASA